jgi:asparagine synthase (glutamine-hydrolysing)
LGRLVRRVYDSFPKTRCPLTAGRDSRVLAAVVAREGLRSVFYTRGSDRAPDVVIARSLARVLGAEHVVEDDASEQVRQEWPRVVRRLVLQSDGMVSLWQLFDVARIPDRGEPLASTLGGIGGEIARRFYDHPEFQSSTLDVRELARVLGKMLTRRSRPLLTDDGLRDVRELVASCLTCMVEAGAAVRDLPDLFYADERVRRWGGTNARKIAPVMDTFAPLATRPFLEGAFALSVRDRQDERLHDELMRQCCPDLLRVPFDGPPPCNRGLRSVLERLRARTRRSSVPAAAPSEREVLLREKREEIRSVCLDDRRSDLWSIVNRGAFERMTSDAEQADFGKHLEALCSVATVAYFFREIDAAAQ